MTQQDHQFSARKVARLARIHLRQDQLDQTQSQLDEILEFVEQLNEVELDGIEPFFGAADANRPVRMDEVHDSLRRNEALANSPHHDEEYYLVPPVFGKSG